MKTLVIGNGEVGKSLFEVLTSAHEAYMRDIEHLELDGVEVLNICFPCRDRDTFIATVKRYVEQYKPKLTIIHSTVPVGTTRMIGKKVVHSPIHGKHPNLQSGILTFVKFVGGHDVGSVYLAQKFLSLAGIRTEAVSSAEASELSKLLCTTYYGWNLVFMKEAVKVCDQYGLPFHEVYTKWNTHYNEGYEALGMPEVRRPVLNPVPGPIGGHCVVPNCDLLDSFVTKTIKERNEAYKAEQ